MSTIFILLLYGLAMYNANGSNYSVDRKKVLLEEGS